MMLAPREVAGLGWRALVCALRTPSKEDAMNPIAVAVTPVAVILPGTIGTVGPLG
jgi:hypothetical protein